MVSIILPTYNEEQRVARCLASLHRLACERPWGKDLEVILVDDGSRDRTIEIAREQLARFPASQLLNLPWHAGKGAAVRLGVATARGDAIVFMDADLATELNALAGALEALSDAEVVVGSRAIPGAVVTGRSRVRTILHRAFRAQVRRLTGVLATDPQCGFKAFRRGAAKTLFAIERVDGYAFDIEVLLAAQKLGYRTVEVPVNWRAVSGSHVRVLQDSIAILRDSLRVRLRYRNKAMRATPPIVALEVQASSREPARERATRAVTR